MFLRPGARQSQIMVLKRYHFHLPQKSEVVRDIQVQTQLEDFTNFYLDVKFPRLFNVPGK
jgi:hypothetical protein